MHALCIGGFFFSSAGVIKRNEVSVSEQKSESSRDTSLQTTYQLSNKPIRVEFGVYVCVLKVELNYLKQSDRQKKWLDISTFLLSTDGNQVRKSCMKTD